MHTFGADMTVEAFEEGRAFRWREMVNVTGIITCKWETAS
jgi:hypothetical protein